MKATIKGDTLTIEIPLNKDAPLSSSGKNLILASTGGFTKPAGLMHKGKQVSIGLNVISKPDSE